MMTREEALSADEFHWNNCARFVGPRGGVQVRQEVWRRNGMNKTWKTRPDEFRIPAKHGFRTYGEITMSDLKNMHVLKNCPLNDPNYVTKDERKEK